MTQRLPAALFLLSLIVLPSLPAFGEFLDFIGMPEIHELDRRFAESTEDVRGAST